MKKTKKAIVLGLVLLMVLNMVFVSGQMLEQTAKARPIEVTTRLIGQTSSMPSDGAIVSVAGFNTSAYFIDAVGTVYGYGGNTTGELGDGTVANRLSVAPVIKDSDSQPLTGIDRIWGNHNYGIFGYDYDTDVLYGWGLNAGFKISPNRGISGATSYVSKAMPVSLPNGIKVSKQVNAIAVGAFHIAVLDQNGEVWAWGLMHDTVAGKTTENRLGYDFVADGTLTTEHAGEYYNTTTFTYMKVPHKVPLPLHEGEKVLGIYMGWVGINYAFTSENRVIAWGGNNTANLNIMTQYGSVFVEIDKPAGVDASFIYTKMAVGKSSNVVLLGNDGKVYVLNGYSFIGDVDNVANNVPAPGTLLERSKTPVLVTELDYDVNNDGVEDVTYVDVASGADNAVKYSTVSGMAVRSDNTVWVWGNGTNARLGHGILTQDNIVTPAVQISSLESFQTAPNHPVDYIGGSISWYFNHGLMLKNGVVYAWGQNTGDKMYPMVGQSVFPYQVLYSFFPEALRYDGTAYPADTPVADTEYTLSGQKLDGGIIEVTVSGLNEGLNGKEVVFYNENNESYGSVIVAGGQATLQIAGLIDGQTINVFVRSDDPVQKLWAPALYAQSFTYSIDAPAPIVSGVTSGGIYNTDRIITFDMGTAMLNGVPFASGSTVSAEGEYTLVVTSPVGKITTVVFTIDKTAPIVTGVEDGGLYHEPRTITFDEGIAQLDDQGFVSGSIVSEDGVYTLTVTDTPGNVTTLSFEIENVTIDYVIGKNTLSNIFEKMSADDFLEGIHILPNMVITMKKQDGTPLAGTDIVGTGMTVALKDKRDVTFATYTLVVQGDVTGNGIISVLDLLTVKKHVLSLYTLEGAYALAANVSNDAEDKIDAADLLVLKQHLMKINIIAPVATPVPTPIPDPRPTATPPPFYVPTQAPIQVGQEQFALDAYALVNGSNVTVMANVLPQGTAVCPSKYTTVDIDLYNAQGTLLGNYQTTNAILSSGQYKKLIGGFGERLGRVEVTVQFETSGGTATLSATVPMVDAYISAQNRPVPRYEGFGGQFNQQLYAENSLVYGITAENVGELEQKVINLGPQHMRIFFDPDAPYRTVPGVDDAPVTVDPNWTSFEKAVGLAQEVGASVNVTYWHRYTVSQTPEMEVFAEELRHLIVDKGYTNVKYATIFNEPNSTTMTLLTYETYYTQLHNALVELGIRDQIKLIGGDLLENKQVEWFGHMATHMNHILDAYSVHIYWEFWDAKVASNRMAEVQRIVAALPAEAQKPLFIEEFGVQGYRNNWAMLNPDPAKFPNPGASLPLGDPNAAEAIAMADYPLGAYQHSRFAAEAINRGVSGLARWDIYHARYDGTVGGQDFSCIGAYDDIIFPEEHYRIRPGYHAMELMIRTAQVGWQALHGETYTDAAISGNSWMVTGMAGPSGEYTAYVAQAYRYGETKELVVGGLLPNTTYHVYKFNQNGEGTITVDANVVSDARGIVTVTVEPECFVAITTVDAGYTN